MNITKETGTVCMYTVCMCMCVFVLRCVSVCGCVRINVMSAKQTGLDKLLKKKERKKERHLDWAKNKNSGIIVYIEFKITSERFRYCNQIAIMF